MFCPEGYVSLCELQSAFWAFAQDLWKKEGKEVYVGEESKNQDKVLSDGTAVATYVDFDLADTDVHYAYQQWATFRLTQRHSDQLVVCSPDGRVMRLASHAFATAAFDAETAFGAEALGDKAFQAALDAALDAKKVLDGEFPKTQRGQVALVGHLERGHLHITEHYGIISPCSDSELLDAYDLADVVAMLKPFEGWAVCWKPKDFITWRSELQALLSDQTVSQSPPRPAATGRPRRGAPKKDDGLIETAIRQEFGQRLKSGALPLGKKEAIYAEMIAWAEINFCKKISRTTAQRYLNLILSEQSRP